MTSSTLVRAATEECHGSGREAWARTSDQWGLRGRAVWARTVAGSRCLTISAKSSWNRGATSSAMRMAEATFSSSERYHDRS